MEYSDQAYNFDKYRPSRHATKVFCTSENLPPNIRHTQHSSAREAKRDNLTFYGEIKRVLIILRILGVLPYSTTSAGRSNFTQRDLLNWLHILKCIAWKCYTHVTDNLFSISWIFTNEHYYEEVNLFFTRITFISTNRRISNYTKISSLKIKYCLINNEMRVGNHKYIKY
jgi:hypothetical protein